MYSVLRPAQVDDRQARFFHFRKQRIELNWQRLHALDLDDLMTNVDTEALDKVGKVGEGSTC